MHRFRLLFLAVALALLAPLGFLVQRAPHSVALERQLHHRACAERAFDEMERSLSTLLERETAQPVEDYGRDDANVSWPFVLGRFQIDSDGNVHVLPMRADKRASAEIEQRVGAYWRAARVRPPDSASAAAQVPGTTVDLDSARPAGSRKLARDDLAAQKAAEDGSALDVRASFNKEGVAPRDVLRAFNKAGGERAERQRLRGVVAAPVPYAFVMDEREAGAPQAEMFDAARVAPDVAPLEIGRAH